MTGKNVFSATLPLLIAALQAGCMTSSPAETCAVEGAQFLSSSATDAEVCALFRAKLAEASGDEAGRDNLAMTITIEKSGTINASIADTTGSGTKTYPTVSVDVMDRPLNLSDVEQLAASAARMMQTEDGRSAASPE